jgi:AcrR family transcriptional regulator
VRSLKARASSSRLVETVVARAGVPQSAFCEVFESAEDCILAAFSEGLQRLSEAVLQATRSEERWLARIRVGLVAALGFLEDEPQWAHLLILERPLEGVCAIECTQRVHDALGAGLAADEARPSRNDDS